MEKQQITTWLFVSKSKDRLENTTLGFLQRKLCSIHSTTPGLETLPCMASNCRQLKHHEHHSAYWLKPHKATYLVEDLALLFEITHFARTHEQPCFFIIEQAELLSTTCANKLLKLLEEPSEGYFFILTTTQPLKILPTIASRCVTQFVDGTYEYEAHPLLLFFFPTPKLYLPFEFEQTLKKSDLSNTKAEELIQDLYAAYLSILIESQKSEKETIQIRNYYQMIVDFLKHELATPPASGSAELFFKKLYLSFPRPLP